MIDRSKKRRMGRLPVVLAAVSAAAALVFAASSSRSFSPAERGTEPAAGSPGIVEHLGQAIPPDIVCRDEDGVEVSLAALLDRPAILSLVYYSCEHICPQVLVGLGRLVTDPAFGPAPAYRLITLSFDSGDTPRDAAAARMNSTSPLPADLPRSNWLFLTATRDDIGRLTEGLGFRFEAEEHGFVHPAVLVVLGPGGLISHYVYVSKFAYGTSYPVTFSAVAMAASLRIAAAGGVEPGAKQAVLFCFPHEPVGQSRYFGLLSLAGLATLAGLAALFVWLSARGRRNGRIEERP